MKVLARLLLSRVAAELLLVIPAGGVDEPSIASAVDVPEAASWPPSPGGVVTSEAGGTPAAASVGAGNPIGTLEDATVPEGAVSAGASLFG